MGFLKPDPPTPPNPLTTAAAQTSTNVNTAVANAYLNNTNQNTPEGSLNYQATGSYGWTDPTTGQTYNIPTFTSTQSLNPVNQNIKNLQDQSKTNMAQMASDQSARVAGLLGSPFNPTANAPSAGSAQNISGIPAAATSYAQAPAIQSGLGDFGQQQQDFGQTAGQIVGDYGANDFSADRSKVQEALMGRINPQLDVQRNQLQQQLADQGIRYGSAAYNNAMMPFNQQVNDAQFAAISQAGQEQQRMQQEAEARAQFQNAAQQQDYTQQYGRGTFANEAQQQMYNQALGAGSYYNQAQNQQFQQNAAAGTFYNSGIAQQLAQQQAAFNASQAARNQYMQEAYQQRNQPINEITSLMSGSQIQNPSWLNSPQSQIPTTDIAGLQNQNFNQQLGIYQQQTAQANQLIGGTLGLGAGALKLSDEREKENIDRIGTVFAASHDSKRKKLPIYQYSYKDDPVSTRHIGPMAQDVEAIEPGAVEEHEGRKFIKPRQVMGSILRAS
jgi:hypothetical protein